MRELAAAPGVDVQLVSGRAVETLEAWLGALPMGLWAEHGLWHRPNQEASWELTVEAPRDWMERVRPIIRRATQATPGSLVEEKTASFAWHYRTADPDLGERHSRELRAEVATALADEPVEVLEGSKVVEIRLRGVSKALVIPRLAPGTFVVAVGDDRTDEDMFAALPADGVAIHVGPVVERCALPVEGLASRPPAAARADTRPRGSARELTRLRACFAQQLLMPRPGSRSRRLRRLNGRRVRLRTHFLSRRR